MNLQSFSFQTLDWSSIPKEERKGETGLAYWQTFHMNTIRIRKVEYSPGYKSDHWCSKGHVLHCMEGEMLTELDNGKVEKLTAGMTYFVGDNCEAHRSSTETGCKLFIVD
jgi:quercetin dioxygenase-like cupin family protein